MSTQWVWVHNIGVCDLEEVDEMVEFLCYLGWHTQ